MGEKRKKLCIHVHVTGSLCCTVEKKMCVEGNNNKKGKKERKEERKKERKKERKREREIKKKEESKKKKIKHIS